MRELRALGDPDAIASDVVMQRFTEHSLQVAIQAALDVASRVVSEERLGEARTNHELFDLLARGSWIPTTMVPVMRAMVGFRNVVVHEYDDVDLGVVRDVVENHLDDLLAFADAIRTGLAARA